MTDVPNAEQIDAWNNRSGPKWAALQSQIDAMFTPVTSLVLELAAARSGERVLDIGCGTGDTLLRLGQAVGPGGTVLGVDVSRPMLEVAAQRVAAEALSNASTLLADASAHAFAPSSFDLLFSRFGVMFFDDPLAAFRNLRSGAAPGGRLAFVCWRPLAENEWFRVPLETVQPVVGDPPPPSDAPGPFAFARPERVSQILEASGFASVSIEPRDVALDLGGPEQASAFVTQVGATARLLLDVDPDIRAKAHAALENRFARAGNRVVLGGAVWLVSAQVA